MRSVLYVLAALLVLPALLINLGAVPFIDDEAIRALVAWEMLETGNFVAPTMHGDTYLNKPPGWNWVLALSFTLFGGASEYATRVPTVVAVLGFAMAAFFLTRRYLGTYLAVVHALTIITCGRMLFWDSMLGLIDVCFSGFVFVQLVLLYHFGHRGQWWAAFGWSYGLLVVTFLLKGLPAIVFQGLTVLAVLGWTRSWRQFFRPPHLVSGALSTCALALYYLAYSQYVDLSLVIERLFIESGKRTAAAHSLGETLGHVLVFPFEMPYHFLPWTALLLLAVHPRARRAVREHDFAGYCLVVFLVNLPVYWLSPNVYPRYLLMLFPLLFVPLLVMWARSQVEGGEWMKKGLTYLFLVAMTISSVGLFLVPLIPETAGVAGRWVWAVGLGLLSSGLTYLVWTDRRPERPDFLLTLGCFLLLLRLALSVFVLPARGAGDVRGLAVRDSAVSTMRTVGSERAVAVYGFSLIEPATGYYLSLARNDLVRRQWEEFDRTTVYIVSPAQYPEIADRLTVADSVYLRHQQLWYPVGTFDDPPVGRAPIVKELRDGMGTGIPLNKPRAPKR